MRKILSLVLVLSMVLGSLGYAFAVPKDVEDTNYEDAVTRLMALEILSGFPDGTFKPNETVTRAQCAKIMIHALGVGEAAKYVEGQTKFSDVPANHWASGYINVASDMKVINGYGNGNFGPEDKVTYAQAITMIVRALGYEPKAQAIGGYPGGYIAIAAEEDITEDINVVNTLAATRGDIALMVDASLDVNLMYQKTWGQYPEYVNDDDSKTLLKTKLGVDEISGTVVGIPNTDNSLDDKEIKVKYKDGNQTETEKYELLVSNVNIDSLLGLELTLWADDSEVINLDIDTDSDDIIFDTVDGKSTSDDITLYVEDDTLEWASGAEAYVNFENVKLRDVPDDAYGYFVLNDSGDVVYANVFDFNEVSVCAVYDIDGDVYNYVEPSSDKDEIELSDYEDGVFVYNEKMELVDDDDIQVNSAIFAWETSDELYLIVKNDAVKGKLEKIKANEVSIDGDTYDKAKDGAAYSDDKLDTFDQYSNIDSLDNLGGEQVVAVLDLNDELIFIHGDSEATSGTKYGVVTYAELKSKARATVSTKEGEEIEYIFEERSDALGIEQGNNTNDIDYFEKRGDGLVFSVMKFKLNKDGEIDSDYITDPDADENRIDVIDFSQKTELLKDANKKYVWIDRDGDADTNDRTKYYISEDTVLMTALDSKGYLAPALLDYDDIYRSKIVLDDAGTDTQVYIYGEAGKDADFILFLDKSFTGFDEDYYYGVVTDTWFDGDDYIAKIDVFDEGEDEYVLANEDHFDEGKIVKFHYNIDNEIVRDAVGNKDDDGNFDYDDGYLNNTDDGVVKISSKAVVYELDSDGDIEDEVSPSKVDDSKFKTLVYILNEDEMVVAATVTEKADNNDDEGEIDGIIAEYINTTGGIVVYDGIAYTINSTTLLYDNTGELIESGEDILTKCNVALLSKKVDIIISEDRDNEGNKVLKKITFKEGIAKSSSSVVINPTKVDIGENATVSITLKDVDNNSYTDLDKDAFTITVSEGSGTVTLGNITETSPGTYRFTAKNDVDETRKITVTVGGVKLSNTVNLFIDEAAPEAPNNFTATNVTGRYILLSWANQSSDSDLHHFEIYYRVGGTATDSNTPISTNVSKTKTSELFDASSLADGTNVYFAIYAVDAFGNKVKADAHVTYQSGMSEAPTAGEITVTNNNSSADTVEVANVPAGAEVKVYDASAGGSELENKTNNSGSTGSVTVTISQLGSGSGSVYVTITESGKAESTPRTEKAYAAEALSPSTAPTAGEITVTNNNGSFDTIVVANVPAGAEVKVYDASAGGSELENKTNNSGSTGSVTVTISQLGSGSGSVYVTITESGKAESTPRTEKAYAAEPLSPSTAPTAGEITVTNNNGSADTVEVANVPAGAEVKVYDASAGGSELENKTNNSGSTGSVTVTISQLGSGSGSVYVTITESGKAESTPRTEKAYAAEPLSPSTAPTAGEITVTNNNGSADTVEVANVPAGADVKVYNAATGGSELGNKTNNTGSIGSVTVTIAQLGEGAGSVYVTITESGKAESVPRTEKAYDAEPLSPSTAPAAGEITVTNNNGSFDTIVVANVPAGARVKVYKVATGGNPLKTKKNKKGSSSTITVKIRQLGTESGSIYVTITEDGKAESTPRTEKVYAAE